MKGLFMLAIILTGSNVMAQGLFNKLKQKAEKIAGSAIENVIDGKVKKDEQPQSSKGTTTNPSISDQEASSTVQKTGLNSTTVYDFVSGSKVLLADDFSQDAIGPFPLKWYTRSKGEVVALNNTKGRWLRLYPGSFVSPVVNIGENATIEFDLIMDWPLAGGYMVPAFNFAFYDRGNKGDIMSYDYRLKNCLKVSIAPYRSEAAVQLTSYENVAKKLETDKYRVANFDKKVGDVVHVAISIQKERIRIWLDKEKVFDLPNAVPVNSNFNQLKLDMGSSNYTNDQLGFYVSNFRFAEGSEDGRSKLLSGGKLETSSILFATNSAEIKSDREGIIKEVATVLRGDPTMKIRIIGHTDAVGNTDKNLLLSKKRADAVRDILINDYQINMAQIETDGKGDTVPVADESSEQNKAKNRRVEFVKI